MIKGETVTVHRREQVGTDPGNNPVYEWTTEDVENVLVEPGSRSDIEDSHRPEGVQVAWTLGFPKGFPENLRGALVAVRGGDPSPVVGDPKHYTLENTPGPWSMPVELERVDG